MSTVSDGSKKYSETCWNRCSNHDCGTTTYGGGWAIRHSSPSSSMVNLTVDSSSDSGPSQAPRSSMRSASTSFASTSLFPCEEVSTPLWMINLVGCQLALASSVRNSRATDVRIAGVAVIASRKPFTMSSGVSPSFGRGGSMLAG